MDIRWCDVPASTGVYGSRTYGEAAALSTGAEWTVLGDGEGRWRVPVCLSVRPGGLVDASSPYGYSGIHAAKEMTGQEISEAWAQTRGMLAERGVVSLFLRFAPYREEVERWHHELEGLRTVESSATIVVATADDTGMWAGMQGRARTAVRKAEREGLIARVEDADLSLARDDAPFRRVYSIAMDRVGAAAQHRHGDEYYRRLVEGLGADLKVVAVRNPDGEVVASCLLLIDDDGVHYHLSGSLKDYARLGANNLMIWTALRWASAQGHAMVHLGGGTSAADDLYRFKASFGGTSLPFFVGQSIIRPDDYARLVVERAAELHVSVGMLERSHFFPAYRAVVPS